MVLVLLVFVLAAIVCRNAFLHEEQREENAESGRTEAAQTESTETRRAEDLSPNSSLPFCVVIDPGHQRHGNSEPEPIGPGASETKARVTSGTEGVSSGLAEYELNLIVALQLRDELNARGYRVVMTREDHDVDLSNAQRAAMADSAGADVCIHLHANGSDRSTTRGIMTVCMSSSNPYHPELYESSRALSERVLAGVAARTSNPNYVVWERDNMSGINWSTVPATILEMGYMSNPEEDLLLADPEYQQKIVQGIADGLDAYFAAAAP